MAAATLDFLNEYLQSRIPSSRLVATALPHVPELRLYLLNDDYPRDALSPEQATALMDDPPYWAFCWASGQVLARVILDHPAWVAGRTVVDFGAGSGVVGIAARRAGARRVVLCDADPLALAVSVHNAALNGVAVETAASLDPVLADASIDCDVITVADVFYDRENLPLLQLFNEHFGQVLVADCRLRRAPLAGLSIAGDYESHTVPDLDESREFNCVTLYR